MGAAAGADAKMAENDADVSQIARRKARESLRVEWSWNLRTLIASVPALRTSAAQRPRERNMTVAAGRICSR